MGYWNNKKSMQEIALHHYKDMENIFNEETKKTVQQTILFDKDNPYVINNFNYVLEMPVIIDSIDSVAAIAKYNEGKVAVLNFSSYKHPGGMFIEGSSAQEECLCHASNLYNVLIHFQTDFYDWNCKHLNRSLYLNRGLYSPDVKFKYKEKYYNCDVLTCAAPNKTSAQRYCKVTNEENLNILDERINFLLGIAANQKVDTLILGAYGCGVFGQDPYEVATIFKKHLQTDKKCFKKVIFAIPTGAGRFNENLNNFFNVFND